MATTSGVLAALGGAGIGAAWGHLLALRGGGRRAAVALPVATALVAGEVLLLAGAPGAAAFATAGAVAWAAGAAWRRQLRRGAGLSSTTR